MCNAAHKAVEIAQEARMSGQHNQQKQVLSRQLRGYAVDSCHSVALLIASADIALCLTCFWGRTVARDGWQTEQHLQHIEASKQP